MGRRPRLRSPHLPAIASISPSTAPNCAVEGEIDADERGTREYNLVLGERRANAVKNYLVALGIAPERIETISYGKERPAVLGTGEAVWRLNRRAVTKVIAPGV